MTIKLDQKYKEIERLNQALIDWDKEQIPFTIQQYLEHPFERTYTAEQMMDFARYFAQRCGMQLDGECEHPYHSVVGGGGKPERCLKCGMVLSE